MFKTVLSKKHILFALACCALLAARKVVHAVSSIPGGPAAPEASASPLTMITTGSTKPAQASQNIPYRDIAFLLEDETILGIVKDIPRVGSDLALSAQALGKLMLRLEQFEADIARSLALKTTLQAQMTCAKAPQAVREKSETCKKVDCAGNRAECLHKAIANLQIMLRPFIQDLFVGSEENGKKVDGIAYTLLDIVHQPGTKKDLDVVIKPLQTALKILEALEKIAKINAQASSQKGA